MLVKFLTRFFTTDFSEAVVLIVLIFMKCLLTKVALLLSNSVSIWHRYLNQNKEMKKKRIVVMLYVYASIDRQAIQVAFKVFYVFMLLNISRLNNVSDYNDATSFEVERASNPAIRFCSKSRETVINTTRLNHELTTHCIYFDPDDRIKQIYIWVFDTATEYIKRPPVMTNKTEETRYFSCFMTASHLWA